MTLTLPEAGPRSRFLFDFNAGACLAARRQSLDARTGQVATFTRAGIQSAQDSAGRLQTFPSGVPAWHWSVDPVTGLSTPGVLLEGAATNLLLWSGDVGNGLSWGQVNVTITPNALPAPDGKVTAAKLAATATGSALLYQFITTNNTRATYSVYAKRGSGDAVANRFMLRNYTTSTVLTQCQINYATGVLTVSTGTASVERVGDGWFRITLSAAAGITVGDQVVCYACFDSSAPTGGDFAYAWGAQFESSAAASSYIPTTSAAVARAACALSFVWRGLHEPCTIYCKHVDRGSQAMGPVASPYQVGAWSSTGSLTLYHVTIAMLTSTYLGASAQVTSPGVATNIVPGDTVESRCTLSATGSVRLGVAKNGGVETLDAGSAATPFATTWAGSVITLNRRQGSGEGFAAFQVFRIAAGARSLDYMRRGGA